MPNSQSKTVLWDCFCRGSLRIEIWTLDIKKADTKVGFIYKRVHIPILTPSPPGTTFGARGLNFRVRDEIGCFPSAIYTPNLEFNLSSYGSSFSFLSRSTYKMYDSLLPSSTPTIWSQLESQIQAVFWQIQYPNLWLRQILDLGRFLPKSDFRYSRPSNCPSTSRRENSPKGLFSLFQ